MTLIKKGFTLIELLVTIGILAVVMAAVLAAINPQQKVFASYDAQAQAGIGQIATALQSWSSQSNGLFPTDAQGLAQLVTDNEFQALPPFPPNVSSWNYDANATATTARIYATMQATRNTSQGAVWCWRSATNIAGFSTVAACTAP